MKVKVFTSNLLKWDGNWTLESAVTLRKFVGYDSPYSQLKKKDATSYSFRCSSLGLQDIVWVDIDILVLLLRCKAALLNYGPLVANKVCQVKMTHQWWSHVPPIDRGTFTPTDQWRWHVFLPLYGQDIFSLNDRWLGHVLYCLKV